LNIAGLRAVLRDPLYRWEVRRYWTWPWYALLLIAVAALTALAGWDLRDRGSVLDEGYLVYAFYPAPTTVQSIFVNLPRAFPAAALLSLFVRLPLALAAAVGGALAIAPERASGRFEQLVLTPLDPWRFCLARYFGRLTGLLPLWLAAGVLLAVAWSLMVPGLTSDYMRFGGRLPSDPEEIRRSTCFLVAMHVDMAAMLLVCAAVGLRFSATSRSAASAVAKTCLACFILLPVFMAVAAATGAGLISCAGLAWLGEKLSLWTDSSLLRLILAAPIRLACGGLAVWISLRDARRAVTTAFYDPEATA